MATYNVLSTDELYPDGLGQPLNMAPVSLKEARQIVERLSGRAKIVNAKLPLPPQKIRKPYYRGKEIRIIEERQNGWTLVDDINGPYLHYFAATWEIEYRIEVEV